MNNFLEKQNISPTDLLYNYMDDKQQAEIVGEKILKRMKESYEKNNESRRFADYLAVVSKQLEEIVQCMQ